MVFHPIVRLALAPLRLVGLLLWLIPFLMLLMAGHEAPAFKIMAFIMFAGNRADWRELA